MPLFLATDLEWTLSSGVISIASCPLHLWTWRSFRSVFGSSPTRSRSKKLTFFGNYFMKLEERYFLNIAQCSRCQRLLRDNEQSFELHWQQTNPIPPDNSSWKNGIARTCSACLRLEWTCRVLLCLLFQCFVGDVAGNRVIAVSSTHPPQVRTTNRNVIAENIENQHWFVPRSSTRCIQPWASEDFFSRFGPLEIFPKFF